MKTQIIALSLLAAILPTHADELTDADRETILGRLEKIRKAAESTADSRFRNAISAYRSAMASNNAAIDFYIMCEEKVNFKDLKKNSSAFRDWKRENSDKHSDKDFRTALRQQLRWLILTLEAASEDADREALSTKAAEAVESIVSQAEDLDRHRDIVKISVMNTVFAKAYDLNNIKVEQWPLTPVPIEAVYDQVILPPLRRIDRTDSLRSAWTKRIAQQMILLDHWSSRPGEKLKTGDHSPEYEKFVIDTLPKVQWDAEVDIFKAGDERGAAARMLAHIEKYIAHEAAPQWAGEFIALLEIEPEPPEDIDATPAS